MSKIESLFFYLIIYTLSAFFLSLSKKRKDNKKIDICFIIAILLPVVIAALRDNVGTDFDSYHWIYQGQSDLDFSQWFQQHGKFVDGTPFGLWGVSQIANAFDSQEVYFGLLAFLTIAPMFLFIKNELPEDCCFLTAFMFLTGTFTTGLNIAKQCIAVAFIIYGMRYVFERKFIKYLIFVLIAYCFHPSAAIAFFIYLFWKSENSRFSVKRLLLISLTIIFMFSISYILERIGGRFALYAEGTSAEFNNRTFYLDLAWLFIFFYFRKRYQEKDIKNDTFLILFIVGVIMTISGFVSPYIKRVAMYYTFAKTILIAQLPLLFFKDNRAIIGIIVLVYAIFIFTYSFYILEHSDIIPYNFITRSVI
ncbi:MAG: EpsG family protein [Oscillospiraceae bacterium]|nr:EpsG family protein [Oscillospiraceae bacterium]